MFVCGSDNMKKSPANMIANDNAIANASESASIAKMPTMLKYAAAANARITMLKVIIQGMLSHPSLKFFLTKNHFIRII